MSKQPRGAQGNTRALEVDVTGFDAPLSFTVSQADYGKFVRELLRDPVMAANNLVLGSCDPAQKQALRTVCDEDWGLVVEIAGAMQEQLSGDRQVTLKKP